SDHRAQDQLRRSNHRGARLADAGAMGRARSDRYDGGQCTSSARSLQWFWRRHAGAGSHLFRLNTLASASIPSHLARLHHRYDPPGDSLPSDLPHPGRAAAIRAGAVADAPRLLPEMRLSTGLRFPKGLPGMWLAARALGTSTTHPVAAASISWQNLHAFLERARRMINAKCQCGGEMVVGEDAVNNVYACPSCGRHLRLVCAEQLADGAGAGDFDARL